MVVMVVLLIMLSFGIANNNAHFSFKSEIADLRAYLGYCLYRIKYAVPPWGFGIDVVVAHLQTALHNPHSNTTGFLLDGGFRTL